jgi:hypothetical protein
MWSQLSLVTDTEIGQIEPEATAVSAPWGATTWASARTEAKRDLKIWLERDFNAQSDSAFTDLSRRQFASIMLPAITDRILDRWAPDWVFQLTDGTFTDRTTAARDDTENDLDIAAVFVTPGADRLYVGALWEFEGLMVKLLDAVNANASVLTVNYWSDSEWKSIVATDGTAAAGKTFGQSGRLTWTLPTDWERRRWNGTAEEFYWIELVVSATLTPGTKSTQLLPVRAPDGLKRVACFLALGHILTGLASQAANPDAWLIRVSNDAGTGYRDRAEALYADLRDKGGIPVDLNTNETIDPNERQVRKPIRLRRA